jgi:hypothetical protein
MPAGHRFNTPATFDHFTNAGFKFIIATALIGGDSYPFRSLSMRRA